MPASYLTANGFSNEVIGQFVSNANMYRGNTVTESFTYSFVESVFHKINALVTVIEDHYLDGRGEFYRHNKVEFKDNQGQSVATSSDELFGDLQFKPIDSFVLEVKGAQVNTGSDYDMGGPPNDESEIDIPNYYYFELADGGVPTLMSSSRKFPFTEHVKLDQSYITGNFTYFDRAKGDWSTRTELRDSTLMEMRDEILASNGYIFPDEATNSHFGFFKWYSPKTSNLNEVKGSLSDIETYNLKFLEDRLGGSKPDS
jgi:YARHG domain